MDTDADSDTEPNSSGPTDTHPSAFAVSREGRTLVTLHGGSDTTARDDASASVAEAFEGVTDDRLGGWSVDDATVYEHPTAPFDPYTIAVAVTVTAVVTAPDATRAESVGATVIDDVLETAGLEAISYSTPPTASVR